MVDALLGNACCLTQRPQCANSGQTEKSNRFIAPNASCELLRKGMGGGGLHPVRFLPPPMCAAQYFKATLASKTNLKAKLPT